MSSTTAAGGGDDGDDVSSIAFRPSKRRRVFRRRGSDHDESLDAPAALPIPSSRASPTVTGTPASSAARDTDGVDMVTGNEENDDEKESGFVKAARVPPFVRRRGARSGPSGGIGFSGGGGGEGGGGGRGEVGNGGGGAIVGSMRPPSVSPPPTTPLTETEIAAARAADMGTRFARQSGFKVEVDRHMMAYVDAEMARREPSSTITTNNNNNIINNNNKDTSTADGYASPPRTDPLLNPRGNDRSTTSGALQEVEVSARTAPSAKEPRVRLGRDGKPWRGRWNRRTSDDAARDALVEALLSERMPGHQHYDGEEAAAAVAAAAETAGMGGAAEGAGALQEGAGGGSSRAKGMNEDADERAAAEFARRFAEAAEERRRRHDRPPAGSAGGAGKKDKGGAGDKGAGLIANGPKLGGSRSQRAKMHALEQERLKAGKR